MILLFSFLIAALVIWRGVWIQQLSVKWKCAITVFTLLVAFKFHLLRLFGGANAFNPELPLWVLLPMAWLFAMLIIFVLFLLVYEIAYIAAYLYCRLRKCILWKCFSNPRWRGILLIPAAFVVSIGMYEGLRVPDIKHYTISLPNLPLELNGFTITHLTDIHVDSLSNGEKIAEIVRRSNMLKSDLIVITGDFVDGKTSVRGKDMAVFKELSAPFGVYGVPGNHEYYSGYEQWMAFLNTHGVKMLENDHVMLADGKIALGGVTDIAAERKRGNSDRAVPDIGKAFAGVPENICRILLAHQPKLAEKAVENGVDLQLSGHTHGGMIWGLDKFIGSFNHGLVSGLYRIGKTAVFISNGTGIWNGFPIRFGRPSEIAHITLVSEM